jgi:branched-chain amino acid transport system permease protein
VDASAILQTFMLSLSVAGLYAAIASGLTLEFGVTRIINFAHGEFVMIGAFATYFLYDLFGVPPFLGMLIAGVLVGGLAALVYRAFLSRVLRQDEHNQILATIGLSILLLNLAVILWSPDSRVLQAPPVLPAVQVFGATLPGNNLAVLLVGVALYLGLVWFLHFTRQGVQLRLASDDPELAVYAGVNVDRMFGLSFVIGSATAGVAGGLVALVLYVNPMVGTDLVVRAFAIVALGGLGSIPGALVGAVALSLTESAISTFLPGGASWGYGVSFLIIVLVLLVRPAGLFGREMRA